MKVNGTEIFIERIKGKGALNFILIHNAGGNHHFFIHQIELLKKYGDVIWLDLPGHTGSESISNYEMRDLSFIINQVCNEFSLKNICLIGLNNGANIVIDVALNDSLPINSAILIDPPIFMEKKFIAEINEFISELEHDNCSHFVTSLVDALFIATDNRN